MSIFTKPSKKPSTETKVSSEDYIYDKLKSTKVSQNINDNARVIDEIFMNNSGIIRRNLTLGNRNIAVLLVYVEGMIDKLLLTQNIIDRINIFTDLKLCKNDININFIKEKVITSSEVQEACTFDVLVYEMLSGSTVVFIDGCSIAFIISNNDIKGRSVEKPDTEQTIRGSRQAFVENLQTNIVLLRKIIKTPDLAVEILNVGKRTKTSIALVYLKGVINKDLPPSIKNRINEIDIDGIVDSNQIHALIQKHKWTVFPQMFATERVDRITMAVLQGRAAVIVEGTPFVLIVPTTMGQFLTTPDDYYGKSVITSILRVIRYMGLFVSCSISAIYLALTTFHPGLIPTSLTLSITGTRAGLPFPEVLEVLLMELSLYSIQEAALRLPNVVGQTVGIVGGLVLGQAVVQAGIVSPIIVIIVSISAISSFTLPNYTFSLSTIGIRLFLIFCASIFGLYGFVMGSIGLLIHAASLESFGVKYLADYSPYNKETLKDSIIIAPLHTMSKRQDYLHTEDTIKAKPDKKDDSDD